jgi:hypothetical protein
MNLCSDFDIENVFEVAFTDSDIKQVMKAMLIIG